MSRVCVCDRISLSFTLYQFGFVSRPRFCPLRSSAFSYTCPALTFYPVLLSPRDFRLLCHLCVSVSLEKEQQRKGNKPHTNRVVFGCSQLHPSRHLCHNVALHPDHSPALCRSPSLSHIYKHKRTRFVRGAAWLAEMLSACWCVFFHIVST